MDRKIRTHMLFLFREADTHRLLKEAVDNKATGQCIARAEQAAHQLRRKRHPAETTERLKPEHPASHAAPDAAEAMQGPHAENVVDLQSVLAHVEHDDEDRAGHAADNE